MPGAGRKGSSWRRELRLAAERITDRHLPTIQNSFACKENKTGTAIAGSRKLVLTCSLYVPERSRTFNLKVASKTAFTGARAAAAGLSAAGGEGTSLVEEIGGRIRGLLGGALDD